MDSSATGVDDPTCCTPSGASALPEADATELAGVFAALSDPVRLRLYALVRDAGEVCSCDLQGPLGRSQPTVSHHTKVLADAGLIVGEKRGRWVWWRAVPGRLGAAVDAVGGSGAQGADGSSGQACLG